MGEKLRLYGFNNLTKALSFNIYDVCYAKTPREQRDYIAYIDEQYNSERLTNILTTLTDMIGAKVLNIARQDYDPQGASVTILIAEGSMAPAGDTVLGHLDKSHVTVHTYPEYHPETFLATFRVDIDVATCGEITPLSTLDYLIGSFDSDIITMDYRVRGFTRDLDGKKLFLDHDVVSIQHYIDPEILRRYDAVDINVYEANLFHTKMMVKDIDLQNYLFNTDVYERRVKVLWAVFFQENQGLTKQSAALREKSVGPACKAIGRWAGRLPPCFPMGLRRSRRREDPHLYVAWPFACIFILL